MTLPTSTSADTNPFEAPQPRDIRLTQVILRVVVAMQCFGMAAAHLHHQQPDLFCELILKSRDLPADQISNIADIAAYLLAACGVFTLLRPATLVLLPLIVYQAGTAIVPALQGDGLYSRCEPALQATQIAVPLALMLVDFWPPRIKPSLAMCLADMTFLKFATAAAFIAHGLICIDQARQGGPLLDLFHQAFRRGIRENFPLQDFQPVLATLGAIEVGLAVALFTGRSRLVMAACAATGLLIASVSIAAQGAQGYRQCLSQISLMGAPLASLVFHLTSVREQLPLYLPEIRKSPPA